nr:HEPN domain-containing protein [Acidovorax sp. sic0104]
MITKFMLINVGLGWTREAIPKEVQESVRTKDAKLDHDYLYEVDFIQLSNFLFKEYATTNPNTIIDRLRQAQKIEDLDLDELKKAIPKSNWDRFFSKVVNCDNEYLRSRWDKLYERRNQIAHNRPIGRSEYEEISRLKDELHPKFIQAIENLDQLKITEDERELVSENVATSKSDSYSDFISKWNEFHMLLYKITSLLSKAAGKEELVKANGTNVRNLVNIVTRDFKVFSGDQRKEVQDLLRLRNYMVHEPSVIVPPTAISENIDRIQVLINLLKKKMSAISESGIINTENGPTDQFHSAGEPEVNEEA